MKTSCKPDNLHPEIDQLENSSLKQFKIRRFLEIHDCFWGEICEREKSTLGKYIFVLWVF